jgi:hypothetical protein
MPPSGNEEPALCGRKRTHYRAQGEVTEAKKYNTRVDVVGHKVNGFVFGWRHGFIKQLPGIVGRREIGSKLRSETSQGCGENMGGNETPRAAAGAQRALRCCSCCVEEPSSQHPTNTHTHACSRHHASNAPAEPRQRRPSRTGRKEGRRPCGPCCRRRTGPLLPRGGSCGTLTPTATPCAWPPRGVGPSS